MANPYNPTSPQPNIAIAFEETSTFDKAVDFVRRVTGRRGYEELATESRERDERRQQETPSAVYAHKSIEETLRDFATSATNGLGVAEASAILEKLGPNEFELPPDESLWLKFAKQVYENPLILLLLGSAVVSALMGEYDDAVCVVIAVTIVLTGEWEVNV